MKLKLTYMVLSLLVFTGCQKVIDFSGEVSAPEIVLNSFLTPDSVVSAQVSLSRFFLSSDTIFTMIDTAHVSLFVNGSFKETLVNRGTGVYRGTYKPLEGDSVSLLVQVTGENPVVGGTRLMAKPIINNLDTVSVETGKRYPIITSTKDTLTGKVFIDTLGYSVERKMKFVLNFTDPSERDYYRLYLVLKTTTGTKSQYSYTFSFDDVVSGNKTDTIGPPSSLATNKYNIFTDELFNASAYPLAFSLVYTKNYYKPAYTKTKPVKELTVVLQNISHDYYKYLNTRATIKTNTFFAEPVQVYSNVSGGLGILGSYTSNVVKITL